MVADGAGVMLDAAPMATRAARLAFLSLLAILPLGGCSLTRVKTSWKAPDVQAIRFKKVVAFVITKDEAVRRNGEHQLCERIRSVPCAPAFAVVADADRGDVEKLAQQVDAAGFDGAVVLRYAGQRTQQTYVPAAPLWGYYGYGWGMAYDPGYVRQDELVDVETAVYAVPDRRLLWVGTTESMNPQDVRRTVDEIVDAVAAEMRKEGLIPSD
jgi:hypothetical protein